MNIAVAKSTDESFFIELKNDDEKSFDHIFRKYYTQLCKYACTYLKDADDSEEVVQEVFINIWNNRKKIDINTSVSSYLYRAVKNQSLNFIRQRSKFNVLNADEIINDSIEEVVCDESRYTELEKNYKKALDELPDKCREIFVLSRSNNMKYKEIAEKLDISIKTVETQMSIALKRLREAFSKFK